MRLYFDACCLNRPFDDQFQHRVRIESEAVRALLTLCKDGRHQWVASDVLALELSRIPDPARRTGVMEVLRFANEHAAVDQTAHALAARFGSIGLPGYDALHLAVATVSRCDILLTTDDRFLARAARLGTGLKIRTSNPVAFLTEGSST